LQRVESSQKKSLQQGQGKPQVINERSLLLFAHCPIPMRKRPRRKMFRHGDNSESRRFGYQEKFGLQRAEKCDTSLSMGLQAMETRTRSLAISGGVE
jgi:hypothetical protein